MRRLLIGRRIARGIPWVLALAFVAGPAHAKWDTSGVEGYIDVSPLVALADEHPDIAIVEVTIPRSLLKAVSEGVKDNAELHDVVFGLEWVGAVILEIEDAAVREKAREFFTDTERRLVEKGWERLARIREEGARVNVFILNGNGMLRGVVVMVSEDGEYVLTNLAGRIDPQLLGKLSQEMDIPGLDQISEGD